MTPGFIPSRHVLLLLIVFLMGNQAFIPAQTPELNLHKYWVHRHRLLGDGSPDNPGFVKVVDDPRNVPGSMIPVSHLLPFIHCGFNYHFGQDRERCGIGDQGMGGVLGGADGTIHLGWYICMLAMEYRLLDMSGQPDRRDSTALELWKSLEAYERLDSAAETKYGFPGVVDGFFLRDDMPQDYHAQPDPNGNPNFPGYDCIQSSLMCNEPRENSEAYSNVPSGDQINFLMLGAAMVRRCLPPGRVIVRGEDVRYKAQRMAHLIITRLRNDRWYIRSPYGTKVPVGPQNWVYAFPMAEAANFITGNNTDLGFEANYHDAISRIAGGICWNAIRETYATLPPVDICLNDFPGALQMLTTTLTDLVQGDELDDICWNPKNPVFLTQVLSLAVMSNTFPPELIAFISYLNGVEIYPLLHNILHGSTPDDDIVRKAVHLVDLAPCEKFCWVNPRDGNPLPYEDLSGRTFPCDNVWEWRSNFRWGHPKDAEGDAGRLPGNSLNPGMDFLLLYNALLLARPNLIVNGYRDTQSKVLRIEGEFPRQVTTAFGCRGCAQRPAVFYHPDSIYLNARIRVAQDAAGNPVPGALYLVLGARGSVEFGPDFEAGSGTTFQIVYGDLSCDNAVFSYPTPMPDTRGALPPDSLGLEDQLLVFPNPSAGLFHLETAGAGYEKVGVEVLDPAARLLFRSVLFDDYKLAIDLRGYPAGFYLLRVHWGERVYYRRLVVAR